MLTPQQTLKQYFGFEHFREGQPETIDRALAGKHTLLVMPTGSGKSLTYQLPALLKPGLTLVISPLIALMKDQVDGLTERGISATYINSSLPGREVQTRMRAVLEGDVKLLYVAPERLRNRQFTKAMANTKISMLAVDEAHCISQWGHDFRPDYLQIGPAWQAMGQPTLLATTATATVDVQKDIVNQLNITDLHTIVTGFNRPNLHFQVKHTPDDRTKLQALQMLFERIRGSVIIYVATRRNADDVADFLQHNLSIPTGSYHGGLGRDIRTQIQTDFMRDKLKVVVATNAFGMGVDKPDVRAVIHYNIPGTVEAYYQEAGRAGRDGLPADCIMLFAPDDQGLQEWFITSDTPALDDLYQIYGYLAQDAGEEEVYASLTELAQATGLHPVKVRVAISELEQANLIYHLGNQGQYDTWKILPFLEEALVKRAEIIKTRSQIRLRLLESMLKYAHLLTCRRQYLLDYFGDTHKIDLPHCCDNHAHNQAVNYPKATTPEEWYPLIILDTVRSLERPVGRNRLAQILSGSQSKAIRQFNYDRHRFYGKLAHLRKGQVVSIIDQLIELRYLQIEGGRLPILRPTFLALNALEERIAIPLKPMQARPPVPLSPKPLTQPDNPSPLQTNAIEQPQPSVESGNQPPIIDPPKAVTVADKSAEQIIVDAVGKLGGTLGRSGLAKFLTGSKVKWLEAFADHTLYGQLEHYSQQRVINLIDALIAAETLVLTQGHRPKVVLSSLIEFEEETASIQNVEDKIEASDLDTGEMAQTQVAEVAVENQALYDRLYQWRRDEARRQSLPPYIIFPNKVLKAIATECPETLDALATISGIGPKKQARYGETVIALVLGQEHIPEPEYEVDDDKPRYAVRETTTAAVTQKVVEADFPQTPLEIILTVVKDLDGLLDAGGVVRLLLAAEPDEIAPFRDHKLYGRLYEVMSQAEIEHEIQRALQMGYIMVNGINRLKLTID